MCCADVLANVSHRLEGRRRLASGRPPSKMLVCLNDLTGSCRTKETAGHGAVFSRRYLDSDEEQRTGRVLVKPTGFPHRETAELAHEDRLRNISPQESRAAHSPNSSIGGQGHVILHP